MPDVAYVNGWIGPLHKATVSILDRAFLFGDGAYEVIRAYSGQPFELDAHLARLEASLAGLEMRMPLPQGRFAQVVRDLLRRSGHREARIYMQVTRGAARREHAFPRRCRPTLVIAIDKARPIQRAAWRRGFRAVTLPDSRWSRCHLKALVLLPNVLARQQARRQGAEEAILLGPGGFVREGAASNVFLVRRRVVQTHPLGPEILPGVSRRVVVDLARQAGLRVVERRFRLAALLAADEVFLSSTMLEVMPVVRIDDHVVGAGVPGPVSEDLAGRFRAHVRAHLPPRPLAR